MICSGVRDNKESRLFESGLDLIGECAGSEAAGHRRGARVLAKLQNSALRDANEGERSGILEQHTMSMCAE